MGNSSSCIPIVKKGGPKAKLVLEDGRLRQFSTPIKVLQIFTKAIENPTCFICNADDLNFDEYVHPLVGDDELQLGQLYFELPSYWLKSQLSADQMGALAVKASKALCVNGGKDHCRFCRGNWCGLIRRRIDPLEFICKEGDEVYYRGEGKRLVDDHSELWVILEEEGDPSEIIQQLKEAARGSI